MIGQDEVLDLTLLASGDQIIPYFRAAGIIKDQQVVRLGSICPQAVQACAQYCQPLGVIPTEEWDVSEDRNSNPLRLGDAFDGFGRVLTYAHSSILQGTGKPASQAARLACEAPAQTVAISIRRGQPDLAAAEDPDEGQGRALDFTVYQLPVAVQDHIQIAAASCQVLVELRFGQLIVRATARQMIGNRAPGGSPLPKE